MRINKLVFIFYFIVSSPCFSQKNIYLSWSKDTIYNRIDSTLQSIFIIKSPINVPEFCCYNSAKEISVNYKIKKLKLPNCIKYFDSLSIFNSSKSTIKNINPLLKLNNLEILYIKVRKYDTLINYIPKLTVLDIRIGKISKFDTLSFPLNCKIEYIDIHSSRKSVNFNGSFKNLTNLKYAILNFNVFNPVYKINKNN